MAQTRQLSSSISCRPTGGVSDSTATSATLFFLSSSEMAEEVEFVNGTLAATEMSRPQPGILYPSLVPSTGPAGVDVLYPVQGNELLEIGLVMAWVNSEKLRPYGGCCAGEPAVTCLRVWEEEEAEEARLVRTRKMRKMKKTRGMKKRRERNNLGPRRRLATFLGIFARWAGVGP